MIALAEVTLAGNHNLDLGLASLTFVKLRWLATGSVICAGFISQGLVRAASPEDLALPVRKGASAKSSTAKSPPEKKKSSTPIAKPADSKSAKPKGSTSEGKKAASKTRTAAKTHTSGETPGSKKKVTRANSSKVSGSSASSEKGKKQAKAPAQEDGEKKPKTATERKRSEQAETHLEETEPRAPVQDSVGERKSVTQSDEIDLPEPQVRNPMPVQDQASLPPPPRQPHQGGFLRRLFGSRSRDQENRPTSPNTWNTDYATRAAGTIVPAMLTGMGWGGVDLPIGAEDTYRLNTLPSDFRPTDLVLIPKEWCFYGNPLYLRREAAESLLRMFNDAAREGKTLRLVSGYRDYQHQLRLYNQSVARRGKNQKMVARPGRSEHQLGTTADVTNSKQHLLKRSFINTPEGQWLVANAGRYGWKMTVMRGDGPRSHADEPWHIRYLGSGNSSTQNIAQQPGQRRGLLGRLGQIFKR